jgi:hypothetical protein
LLIRQGWSLPPTLGQHAEDILTTLPLPHFGNGLTHQVRYNGALVLRAEYLIELSLDVVRNAEIYRSHLSAYAIVEVFNNGMVPSNGWPSTLRPGRRCGERRIVAQVYDIIAISYRRTT